MKYYLGSYSSPIKTQQIKVKRIETLSKELMETLKETEQYDAVMQEGFERQLEVLNKNIINTTKNLTEETAYNNELVKENHVKDVRIKLQAAEIEEYKEQLQIVLALVAAQKKKINKYRHKFMKWLKLKLKNKKYKIKELVNKGEK